MNRFKWWAMSLFSSVLVFLSVVNKFHEENTFGNAEIIIICWYASTIVLSLGGVITSICYNGNLKRWVETILILLNLILWTVLVIVTLIGASGGLTQFHNLVKYTSDQSKIEEPNIYFFSFGSFYNSIYLASSWFKQYALGDDNALTTTQWTFLAASGFLVMATGITLNNDKYCEEGSEYSCARTKVSIFVGLVSGVIGCVLVPWRSAPLKCQAEVAMLLLGTWAIAIGVLTFDKGPAVHFNTMYLGVIMSFFLALSILNITLYADSVLDASPYSEVEFGRTESQLLSGDGLGAAGFLDLAYMNMTKQQQDQDFDDDPRLDDTSSVMLFESTGGSLSSVGYPDNLSTPKVERGENFNRKVMVSKRKLSRVEIWFLLFIESSVCLAVFIEKVNENQSVMEEWIFLAPAISLVISVVGWFTSSIQRKYANVVEGVLILVCIVLWILGLLDVTKYFYDVVDEGREINMTGNQFFMSYGSFLTSIYLILDWSNASTTTMDWIFLSAASYIILSTFLIRYDDVFRNCDLRTEFESCGERQLLTWLALGSACISFGMAFIPFFSCGRPMPLVHLTIGTTLLSLWGVGVYFLVFANDGIGRKVSAMFFACWGTLFFSVDIATTNLVLLCADRPSDEEDGSVLEFFSLDENENIGDEEENQLLKTNEDIDISDDDQNQVFAHQTEEDKRLSIITKGINFDSGGDGDDYNQFFKCRTLNV